MNDRTRARRALVAAAAAFLCASAASAQLTLEACREKARASHPLARQYALIDEGRRLDLEAARRGYLPRLSLSGKASLQSDVTTMNGRELMDKDQYLGMAELAQTLWDGGAVGAQAGIAEASARSESRSLDVELYGLADQVDQLYFGVLSVRSQIAQNEVLIGDLESSLKRVEASLENGAASGADADAVRLDLLAARQRAVELAAYERENRESLALLIGEPVPEGTEFAMPDASAEAPAPVRKERPEVELLDAQAGQLEAQKAALRASVSPKVAAFVQAAYGKPGLDMFDKGFAPYWIAGLRLSWSLNGLLDYAGELRRIDGRIEAIGARKDAFELGNEMRISRQRGEVDRLRALLSSDDEAIALRGSVRKAVEARVDNGAATTDDLLRAIGAESVARQGRALHEVQLAQAISALRTLANE